MGKVSRNQRAARLERELEGAEPYRAGVPAIPRGKRQAVASARATDHPGSKRGRLRRLPALKDPVSGELRPDWRRFRKARSRGPVRAAAMAQDRRCANYERQDPDRGLRQVRPLSKAEKLAGEQPEYTGLTGPQRRRSGKKLRSALARARAS